MTKLILAGLVAATAVATPALAQMAMDGPGAMARIGTRTEVAAQIRTMFARADTNRDGFVTRPEADAARESMQAEGNDRHFRDLDANGDGTISRQEFDAKHAGGKHGEGKHAEGPGHGAKGMAMPIMKPGVVFDMADANRDGRVSLAEATARPLELFDRVDTDRNGTLSEAERKVAMMAMQRMFKMKR